VLHVYSVDPDLPPPRFGYSLVTISVQGLLLRAQVMRAVVLDARPELLAPQVSPHGPSRHIVDPEVRGESGEACVVQQQAEFAFGRRIDADPEQLKRDPRFPHAMDPVGVVHERPQLSQRHHGPLRRPERPGMFADDGIAGHNQVVDVQHRSKIHPRPRDRRQSQSLDFDEVAVANL
jgi:hypothetical protein